MMTLLRFIARVKPVELQNGLNPAQHLVLVAPVEAGDLDRLRLRTGSNRGLGTARRSSRSPRPRRARGLTA